MLFSGHHQLARVYIAENILMHVCVCAYVYVKV